MSRMKAQRIQNKIKKTPSSGISSSSKRPFPLVTLLAFPTPRFIGGKVAAGSPPVPGRGGALDDMERTGDEMGTGSLSVVVGSAF